MVEPSFGGRHLTCLARGLQGPLIYPEGQAPIRAATLAQGLYTPVVKGTLLLFWRLGDVDLFLKVWFHLFVFV